MRNASRIILAAFLAVLLGALVAEPANTQPLVQNQSQNQNQDEDEKGAEPFRFPFPHPAIVEILVEVPPPGIGGDANLDGVRNSVGDQFIELMNPHDRPINLKGYTIETGEPNPQWRLRWSFPDFELGPGEVVVVFNGYRQDEIPGADGDADAPPRMRNPHLGGGWVFSMHALYPWYLFKPDGDWVVLIDPTGQPVDSVVWGEPVLPPPIHSMRITEVKTGVIGSHQRADAYLPFDLHTDINGEHYSPGALPSAVRRSAEPENTTERPTSDTGAQR